MLTAKWKMEVMEKWQKKRSNRKIFYMELLGNTCVYAL